MPPPAEPAPPNPNPKATGRSGCLRRLVRVSLWILLVIAVFHRPFFHSAARLVLIQLAARHNLKLDVHFSGSIFTNLTVQAIRAGPNGHGPTPVEKIAIERVRLDYSLPMLLRHGVGEFLRSYEIHNADLIFVAQESKNERERQQNRSLAQTLNTLLAQPAAYADQVRIDNFNIRVRADQDTEVRGFDLFLHPEQPGYLRVARIAIPKLEPWENLSAETSYEKRNFFIRSLTLTPEIVLDEVNFDASQRAQNKGSMMIKGRFFGGTAQVSLAGTQLNRRGENLQKSYDTTLRVEAQDISARRAAAYFAKANLPVERLGRLSLRITGEPEKPNTWTGQISATVEAISANVAMIDSAEMAAAFDHGAGQITAANVIIGRNSLTLTAAVGLPESVNQLDRSEIDADMNIQAPELAKLTALLPQPLEGGINGAGKLSLHNRKGAIELTLQAQNVGNKQLGLSSANIRANATKLVEFSKDAPLDGLDGHVAGELSGLRFRTFNVDSARFDVSAAGNLLTAQTLQLVRGENIVDAQGSYRVLTRPAILDAAFTIKAPRLQAFGIGVKNQTLAGHLEGSGAVRYSNATFGGNVLLEGGSFEFGGFRAESLKVKADVANNEAVIEELSLQINATDQIAATGKVGAGAPFPYEGALLLQIKDLAVFQPVLEVFAVHEAIGGSLNIDVSGQGTSAVVKPPREPTLDHSGQISFSLDKGRYGKIELSAVRLAGIYGPGFAQSSEFRVTSGPTDLEGAIEIREGRLRLRDLKLQQAAIPVLTGYILLPLDLEHTDGWVPLDKRVAANLNAKELDMEKLLRSFGQAPLGAGQLTANLVMGGTLLQPSAHLKIEGRKLKVKEAEQLDAAELDLIAHYSEKELTLDATLRQPQIQPLTIKGRAPLDLDATVQRKQLPPDLPVELTVKLPPSSLALVPKLVPDVRRIEGIAAIDARLAGTVGHPVLSGSASINIQSARLVNENVPAIGAFQANLAFAEDTLSLKSFRGEVGGGTFNLTGSVRLPTITEPVLDLRLQSDEVLVKRDDSVTVRVDTDVKVQGPLNAATASGNVFVTHSRFFREIDILPIQLPGRPKPKPEPRAVENAKNLSFDKPPLRDWKFDIAVKTRPGDPFRIRGNLAKGGAVLDLKFGGTGLKPWLDGTVRVEDFIASLPFSKLSVTQGFVYFKQDIPFEPQLDLQAESTLRDYHVNAYIYGTASDPQVTLTSEPPLPQQDIVSLLATGTTTSELGQGDALAGRAAVLVFQQLYRKVFKKREPAEEQGLLQRFDVDVGTVDNRTGRQEVSARFKLGENYYLEGDLDVAGDFTGRLKYLLRFR